MPSRISWAWVVLALLTGTAEGSWRQKVGAGARRVIHEARVNTNKAKTAVQGFVHRIEPKTETGKRQLNEALAATELAGGMVFTSFGGFILTQGDPWHMVPIAAYLGGGGLLMIHRGSTRLTPLSPPAAP